MNGHQDKIVWTLAIDLKVLNESLKHDWLLAISLAINVSATTEQAGGWSY